MKYDANEVFRSAAALAAGGMKVVRLYGVRDDGSCTCGRGMRCPSVGKHPAGGDGWQHRATDDENEIASWFGDINDNVRWNIGVRLGRSSGVIDVEADDENALEVMRRFGLDQIDTLAYCGSRGPHYLFQFDHELPDAGVVKVDGLEVRIGGGEQAAQSVFPTSWHRSGVQYKWLPGRSPDDTGLAALPENFKQAVIDNSKKRGTGCIAQARASLIADGEVVAGGRHAFLLGEASKHADRIPFFDDEERIALVQVLRALNAMKCKPPKDDEEVRKIANDQFDYYRDRRLVRRDRRPLEKYGLKWNEQTREYDPGQWKVTVVHSDPIAYRLRIPNRETKDSYVVYLDSKQWVTPREVGIAIRQVAPRYDVVDPNAERWAAVWSGETIEEDEGNRVIRALRLKLLDAADEEYPPPELLNYADAASCLLAYLSQFDSDNDDPDDVLPNATGSPKWIMGDQGVRELWWQWFSVRAAVVEKNRGRVTPAQIDSLRARLLREAGLEDFVTRLRKPLNHSQRKRYIIWTESDLQILSRMSGSE